jgi:hypothetical protein
MSFFEEKNMSGPDSAYVIYPSAKAAGRFRLSNQIRPEPQIGSYPWHLRWRLEVFAINRRFLMLLVNMQTLYAGILSAGGMRDFGARASEKLDSLLTAMGHSAALRPGAESIVYHKTGQRGVIGSMNDMIHALKYYESSPTPDETWQREAEEYLNRTPFSFIGMDSPTEASRKLLTPGETGR